MVIKPPDTAIKPPSTATKPTENSSIAALNERAEFEQPGAVLFDPEIQANSWSPSQVYHTIIVSLGNSFVENFHMNKFVIF